MNLKKALVGLLGLGITTTVVLAAAAPHDAALAKKSNLSESDVARTGLKLLYGDTAEIIPNKDSGKLMAIWKASASQAAESTPGMPYTGEIESTALTVLPIQVENAQQYLVMTQSSPHPVRDDDSPNDCHGCSAGLGGIVFSEQGSGWKVISKTPNIDTLGSWGLIPAGLPILVGPGIVGIRFDLDHVSQGDTDEGMVIVGIVGNQLREILSIPISSSNMDGTCAAQEDEDKDKGVKFDGKNWCYEYTSDLTFVMHPGSDHYDIVVNYGGTDYDETAPHPKDGIPISNVTRTELYVFDGHEYKLAKVVKKNNQGRPRP